MTTPGIKTCNCKFIRNWPFMVSHCRHGFMLVEDKAPLRPLQGPTAADQVQGKGVVAKATLEGLEGL